MVYQAVPTDPAEARAQLSDAEAQLREMEVQHRTLQRAAGRWPRFWLQVGPLGRPQGVRCGVATQALKPSRQPLGAQAQAPASRGAAASGRRRLTAAPLPRLHFPRSSSPPAAHQAGCMALFLQLSGFAYLTWWELSWDVMEPIAYMLSLTYRYRGGRLKWVGAMLGWGDVPRQGAQRAPRGARRAARGAPQDGAPPQGGQRAPRASWPLLLASRRS
jgi:hypothetical protein